MPSPTPNRFKNLIISATGSICEKVNKLLVEFPKAFYDFVSWMVDESGNPTDEFKEWVCALGCTGSGGGGTPNPSMPSPTGISASDGTYSDKVVITWNAVTPPEGIAAVTSYKVYRALSTVTDPNSATLLATVTAPTVTYEDTTAVQGTTYNYWVVATNGVQTSNFGGPDVGNASAPTTTLTAISDLRCTKGFFRFSDGYVALVFTPPTGATKFDIYRSTTNDFSSATAIASDITATDTSTSGIASSAGGQLWDNIEDYTYIDVPPSPTTIYYYWVVAKKDAPPATSAESNVDSGWIRIDGGGIVPVGGPEVMNGDVTVPGGANRCRIVMYGGSGDGAGGGVVYGGGGGGGAGLVYADVTVTPGDTLNFTASAVITPDNTDAMTSGQDAADGILKLNTVEILRAEGGEGGNFDGSAPGTGGVGGGTSGSVAFTGYDGADGETAPSGKGGRGGHRFGKTRRPPAHYNGFSFTSWAGDGGEGVGGGGSYPYGLAPEVCTAGKGATPNCFYIFHAV